MGAKPNSPRLVGPLFEFFLKEQIQYRYNFYTIDMTAFVCQPLGFLLGVGVCVFTTFRCVLLCRSTLSKSLDFEAKQEPEMALKNQVCVQLCVLQTYFLLFVKVVSTSTSTEIHVQYTYIHEVTYIHVCVYVCMYTYIHTLQYST